MIFRRPREKLAPIVETLQDEAAHNQPEQPAVETATTPEVRRDMMDGNVIARSGEAPVNGMHSDPPGKPDPVTLARDLASAVQTLVGELDSQEHRRRELEDRLAASHQESADAAREMQVLHQAANEAVSDEQLQALQQVLQKLAQDPNHIMVLAAVAQQAGTLLQVVTTYKSLRGAIERS